MAHRLPLADIKFIADVAAFARTKGDEEYDFSDNCGCALAQFLRETGRAKRPIVGGWGRWRDGNGERHYPPQEFGDALVSEPYTFSALAGRLELLIADAPAVRVS